jgi:isoleucyl-tRNA synthetase
VAFEIVESPIPELVGAHAVIWTTTPWTIPVNQAIAYGPEIEYVLLESMRLAAKLSLAESSFASPSGPVSSGRPSSIEAARRLRRASDRPLLTTSILVVDGKLARPSKAPTSPAPSPATRCTISAASSPSRARSCPAISSPPTQGTGLVHMAPDHGEDDFLLCKAHGIDPVFAVEDDGRYREDWAWLGGQGSVINAKFNAPDGPICSDLREAGALLAASADFKHSYPHSWRSKAKVIFRCTPQWFIPMDRPGFPSPLQRGEGPTSLGTTGRDGDTPSPPPNPSPRAKGEGRDPPQQPPSPPSTTPAGSPKSPRTASARWSKAAPTG